jgi:hypothetical protein
MPEREPFVFQKYFNNVKYADAFLKIQEPYTGKPVLGESVMPYQDTPWE